MPIRSCPVKICVLEPNLVKATTTRASSEIKLNKDMLRNTMVITNLVIKINVAKTYPEQSI